MSLVAFALPVPRALGDDGKGHLEARRRQVHQQVASATSDVTEASQQAVRVGRALDHARSRLTVARTRLGGIETRLLEARAEQARLRDELVAAQDALIGATDDLDDAQLDVSAQERDVRDSILRLYAYGDPSLRAIGAFFDNATLDDLLRQDVADKIIVGRGSQQLDVLEATEARLALRQRTVEAARDQVLAQRAAARRQLTVVSRLYSEAKDTETTVAGLVATTRDARRDALRVQAADRRQLAALQTRESAIKEQLVRLARRTAPASLRRGESSTASRAGALAHPTGGPVTSPYGYRIHPIYGYYGLHDGIDYGAPCGSALAAAADGKVIDAYSDEVFGNRMFIDAGVVNGKSLVLVYNHMAGFEASEGERVERGEVIGTAGNTGWSTGCHLHFTVMENGVAVDPETYY